MWLATVRTGQGTELHASADGRDYYPAGAWGERTVLPDVGALLRAGPAARAALAEALRGPAPAGRPLRLDAAELAPPVVAPDSLLGVARNPMRSRVPPGGPAPVVFGMARNALAGHDHVLEPPPATRALDYEGELAAVIGRPGRDLTPAEALGHVAGYTIMNDVTARDLKAADTPWLRSKSLDGFAPTGPAFRTAEAVGDPGDLRIRTWVNGELRQDATVGDLALGVADVVALVSEGITLAVGDVVACGTPFGAGYDLDPPRYLAPGDVVETRIEEIGLLRVRVAR